MPSATPTVARVKIRRLAIGIAIFLAVYTGVWFLAAYQIETRLTAFLAGRSNAARTLECDDMAVRGFPFRIGLFCDSLRLDDRGNAASASFGALRSAAQVYWPGRAVIELDGPAEMRVSPDFGLSAAWTRLQASIDAGFSGLNRSSISTDDTSGTLVLGSIGERLAFAAAHGELHLRRNGPDLDAAATLTRFDLRPADAQSLLPPLDSTVDLTVKDRAELLRLGGLRAAALRGASGEVRNLTLDFGNGLLTTASGPFTVSDEGLISGAFKLTMRDVEGWRRTLVSAFPDDRDTIDNTANMLSALSAGAKDASVTLNVRDGTAFLAFIPIGVLPAL
ncbi:DUF2125 domain-containing protein [Rhizobium sp. YIM 134829]|uniref:DUF2125 domain-containing protein n=1 Tax=Rhizobium sp. YIM 134829 TaxID=3390453 RepID=UPI00397ADFF1